MSRQKPVMSGEKLHDLLLSGTFFLTAHFLHRQLSLCRWSKRLASAGWKCELKKTTQLRQMQVWMEKKRLNQMQLWMEKSDLTQSDATGDGKSDSTPPDVSVDAKKAIQLR